MPRKMLMSWDGNRARWTKMYKGRRYLVTCFALGVPGTMQASYQAANNWWEAKKAEIDGYTPAPKDTAAQQALLEGWAGAPLTPEKLATAVLMTYLQDKDVN